MLSAWHILAAFFAGILWLAGPGVPAAQAQPASTGAHIQIVATARPPYMVELDGRASGPAIELADLVARAAGIDPAVRLMPFQRALLALEQGDMLYPALLRTPQREANFQWIGEIFTDRAVFFTRRGSPVVNQIETLSLLPRRNVLRGSELQSLLQSFGISDIEASNSEADNARLLQAGRIDVWFGLRAVGRATWGELGYTPQDLQIGDTIATMPFWLVASNSVPPATVARLRAAYQQLRRDGRYDRIIEPLRKLDSRS
jgi:polar amino acid transport system substrate-binding protein